MEIREVLERVKSVTREELCILTELDDRSVRRGITELRRHGVPVLGIPDGGYKLAETDEEKAQMLHQYWGRAMNMLRTYSLLRKSMQVEGQISVEDLMEVLKDGEEV